MASLFVKNCTKIQITEFSDARSHLAWDTSAIFMTDILGTQLPAAA